MLPALRRDDGAPTALLVPLLYSEAGGRAGVEKLRSICEAGGAAAANCAEASAADPWYCNMCAAAAPSPPRLLIPSPRGMASEGAGGVAGASMAITWS